MSCKVGRDNTHRVASHSYLCVECGEFVYIVHESTAFLETKYTVRIPMWGSGITDNPWLQRECCILVLAWQN